ncbi:MAG: YgfZ/GcvT domain-containing protein [Rhizobiaceae bacterium]
MSECKYAYLRDRTLLQVTGSDAGKLLQGILTCEVEGLAAGQASFGALLTPQGKILFDFFLIRRSEGYLIDLDGALETDFVKRLNFYKLRADVAIENAGSEIEVYAVWSGSPGDVDGIVVTDPRNSSMGHRVYGQCPSDISEGDYQAHRIAVAMPEGGKDFEYGKVFPHEVLMDQFGGVDFVKGCYVGQEVVSRMQHRGKIRTRILRVESTQYLPPFGTEIRAGQKPAGTMGSSAGQTGLALMRLDRVKDAREDGEAITADGQQIETSIPDYANFGWPQD